jgi:hypothetical protein
LNLKGTPWTAEAAEEARAESRTARLASHTLPVVDAPDSDSEEEEEEAPLSEGGLHPSIVQRILQARCAERAPALP